MAELLSVIFGAGFYLALFVGAVVATECVGLLGYWLDERRRKVRLARIRRP